jgi:hypothetical protein
MSLIIRAIHGSAASILLASALLVTAAAFAADDEVVFQATGSTFAALLTIDDGAVVQWSFADGTTSDSATPSKDYGSAAMRENRLKVTPWSALKGVNIGYDAGDGGPYSIPFLDQQNVVVVTGMANMAPYLQIWCSSNNPIQSLDFSNFTQLTEIECYLCQSMASVNLHNTPLLSRACFEDNNLAALDLSESPSLADLRGAVNAYPSITWGTTGAQVWHICVRDNPQMTSNLPDMSQFPLLQELFVWNDNQTGELHPTSEHLTSVLATGNYYETADFTGCFPAGRNGEIEISYNALTSLNISNCPGLMRLSAKSNKLNRAAVDEILGVLDAFGTNGGRVDLTENALPTDTGRTYATNLADRGWTVELDTDGDTNPPIITELSCVVSATGATIAWRTNEAATSVVEYGATNTYGSSASYSALTTQHFVPLTGLTADATIHFRVSGADDLGYSSTSSDYAFTTDSAVVVYWEDNFHRANGEPENGWTSVNDATGQIIENVLRRTDSGAYRILYNQAGGALPADYFVTLTVPNTTINRSWWGLVGRYLPNEGMGSGNKVFWMNSGYLGMGAGSADFSNGITITQTGGYPACWSLNRVHMVTLGYSGTTVTIYLDGQEFGYFTDDANNQAGTGVGIVGDGGDVSYDVYDVKATNRLPVNGIESPFQFTDLPAGGWIEEGNPFQLRVGIADTVGNVRYQWGKDGENITGATNAIYAIDSAETDDAGSYVCLVRDETTIEHQTPAARIIIVPAGSLPVVGVGGITILMVLLILASVRLYARRVDKDCS